MAKRFSALLLLTLLSAAAVLSQPLLYSVEYGDRPANPPSLAPRFYSSYGGFTDVLVVRDNWYYASRERADSVRADAFIIPGGNTSDVPFYDGSLDAYVRLLQNPGRPAMGYCAGLQFLLMARGGICAHRSGETGNHTATIHAWDEIFAGAPNPYTDRAAHSYSITDLPDSYLNLASTRTCFVSFVRHISMPLYGSQLHIESMNNPNSAGPAILANFRNIIMQRKFHGVAECTGFPGEPGRARVTWWRAKTDAPVVYQLFYADDPARIDYSAPRLETADLQADLSGLDPHTTFYFAVRARCTAFADSNLALFPLKPDGHREIIFQNGRAIAGVTYDGCEATVINQAYPNSNYGQQGAPGKGTLYWYNSGLVQFRELEKHLAGKTIIGGKVTFIFAGGVTSQTGPAHVADIAVYPVLKSWNEGVGYNHSPARSGEVTWNAARHGELDWEVAGCRGNSDRTQQPVGAWTIRGDGSEIAFDGTVPLPAALIQGWIDHSDSNNGLLYEKNDTYPDNQFFNFEDNDDSWFMNHPRLVVYYLDESAAPVAEANRPSPPACFELEQNYPNPFNGGTLIPFVLERSERTMVEIHDLMGHLVIELFEGELAAGRHQLRWDGCDAAGRRVPGGIYFYTLTAGAHRTMGRMLVLR